MTNSDIVKQTQLAFDFIQKLYLEVSYLIKEVEGLLAEEPEKFIIGRSGGYAITARSSAGLETNNVYLWPLRKLSVFFVPADYADLKGGQTITRFVDQLRVIYLRVILNDKDLTEPLIYSGVLSEFNKKDPKGKWPVKFEQLMAHFEYNESRVFQGVNPLEYEDSHIKFTGKLSATPLYAITNSQQIAERIIAPSLEAFRSFPIEPK
jgi:hypothetical protein